jgi:hypothetical protein
MHHSTTLFGSKREGAGVRQEIVPSHDANHKRPLFPDFATCPVSLPTVLRNGLHHGSL